MARPLRLPLVLIRRLPLRPALPVRNRARSQLLHEPHSHVERVDDQQTARGKGGESARAVEIRTEGRTPVASEAVLPRDSGESMDDPVRGHLEDLVEPIADVD